VVPEDRVELERWEGATEDFSYKDREEGKTRGWRGSRSYRDSSEEKEWGLRISNRFAEVPKSKQGL